MSNISKLNINGNDYDLKDEAARAAIQNELAGLPVDEKVEIIKNRLNNALADTNAALVAKGATEVTKFDEVPAAIESIQSGEEFIGIKLSGFAGDYSLPTVADARSLPIVSTNNKYTHYMFGNASRSEKDGYWSLLENVYLPNGLLSFDTCMFYYCTNLKNVYGDFTVIEEVGENCFRACTSLASIPYIPQLKTLKSNAFLGCTSLTEFKFYTKPDSTNGIAVSVANTAFASCTNLLDIYVPWSEGEVVNAPWGATNATIHYNTTYDENGNPIVSEV